jgi:hypothetical protein
VIAAHPVAHLSTPVRAQTDRQISDDVLARYVACIVQHTPSATLQELLRIDPDSSRAQHVGSGLLGNLLREEQITCFPIATMAFQANVARGAIYENLYRHYAAGSHDALPRAMPVTDHRNELAVLGPDKRSSGCALMATASSARMPEARNA